MKEENYSIVPAEIVTEIAFHDMKKVQDQGPSINFIDNKLFPGADIIVHARNVLKTGPESPDWIEPHSHEVSQYYIVMEGLTMEVTLNGEAKEVVGPSTILIPAGVPHSARPLRGKGYYVFILMKGVYP